jgi:hypothetical protein
MLMINPDNFAAFQAAPAAAPASNFGAFQSIAPPQQQAFAAFPAAPAQQPQQAQFNAFQAPTGAAPASNFAAFGGMSAQPASMTANAFSQPAAPNAGGWAAFSSAPAQPALAQPSFIASSPMVHFTNHLLIADETCRRTCRRCSGAKRYLGIDVGIIGHVGKVPDAKQGCHRSIFESNGTQPRHDDRNGVPLCWRPVASCGESMGIG